MQVTIAMVQELKSMLRRRGDSLMSACALVAVLTGIIMWDVRLHEQMARRVQGASIDLVGAGVRLQGATADLAAAAQVHTLEFAHLWTFVAVAAVLTVWMFRT